MLDFVVQQYYTGLPVLFYRFPLSREWQVWVIHRTAVIHKEKVAKRNAATTAISLNI